MMIYGNKALELIEIEENLYLEQLGLDILNEVNIEGIKERWLEFCKRINEFFGNISLYFSFLSLEKKGKGLLKAYNELSEEEKKHMNSVLHIQSDQGKHTILFADTSTIINETKKLLSDIDTLDQLCTSLLDSATRGEDIDDSKLSSMDEKRDECNKAVNKIGYRISTFSGGGKRVELGSDFTFNVAVEKLIKEYQEFGKLAKAIEDTMKHKLSDNLIDKLLAKLDSGAGDSDVSTIISSLTTTRTMVVNIAKALYKTTAIANKELFAMQTILKVKIDN